jgi:FkbM family methyltransferase
VIKKIILKLINDPLGLFKILLFRIKLFYKWFYAFYIEKDRAIIERTKWYRDKGDEYLRLEYNLNQDSIVFDIGGYVGDFAEKIFKKFGCKIYLFEPSQSFYKKCLERFKDNKNILCFNYGVGDLNGDFILSNDNEASSTKRKISDKEGEKIKIKKISDIIEELKVNNIDLMKINIEGGEYDLLPFLINENLILKINNIQVQFHNFVPNAVKKREEITNLLKNTHKNDWSYYFVWENWSLK